MTESGDNKVGISPVNGLDNLGFSLRRYYLDRFLISQADLLPQNGLVLDLGGHKLIKRGNFDLDRTAIRPIYLNLDPAKGTDLVADANNLPFVDSSFDGALCCELLEHVFEPGKVIRELFRVCAPGAVVLISTPFLARIHGDPSDYGRYTASFLNETMIRAGFQGIEIQRHGGFGGLLCDLISNWYAQRERNGGFIMKMIGRIVWTGLHWARPRTIGWDRSATKLNESCPLGYGISAIKPVNELDDEPPRTD